MGRGLIVASPTPCGTGRAERRRVDVPVQLSAARRGSKVIVGDDGGLNVLDARTLTATDAGSGQYLLAVSGTECCVLILVLRSLPTY